MSKLEAEINRPQLPLNFFFALRTSEIPRTRRRIHIIDDNFFVATVREGWVSAHYEEPTSTLETSKGQRKEKKNTHSLRLGLDVEILFSPGIWS